MAPAQTRGRRPPPPRNGLWRASAAFGDPPCKWTLQATAQFCGLCSRKNAEFLQKIREKSRCGVWGVWGTISIVNFTKNESSV